MNSAPKSTKRPTSQKIPAKQLKKKIEVKELQVLEGLLQSLNNETSSDKEISEIDSFCQYISKSLTKFDVRTQNIVKNGIQNLSFQAEMGNAGASIAPPQPVYQHPIQPQSYNTGGEHHALYEAMQTSANSSW
jgi:hypothetical protein